MYCKILSISTGLIELYKCILVDFIKCRGSIYALTMFFQYPKYISLNFTRNLMLIAIWRDIWANLQRAYIREEAISGDPGGLYSGFYCI